MDDDAEEPVVNGRERPRQPICADCMGSGEVNRPRAFVSRSAGLAGTLAVPGRCWSCRGTGKAGA